MKLCQMFQTLQKELILAPGHWSIVEHLSSSFVCQDLKELGAYLMKIFL